MNHQTGHQQQQMGSMENTTNYKNDGMMPGNGTHMMMMMMQMYFTAGKEVTILFKQWHTTSAAELFGSCLALFIVGVLYEGLKVLRQNLLLTPVKLMVPAATYGVTTDRNLLKVEGSSLVHSRLSKEHVIQSTLHIVQVFLGYMLMLAVMTYNVWVCIAIILGAGVGHFLFAVKPVLLDNADHCN